PARGGGPPHPLGGPPGGLGGAGGVLPPPRPAPPRGPAARRFPVPRLAIQRPASAFSGRPRRQRPEPRRTIR
ncbi:hypothetical protein DT383_31895, partial [Pseudomonas aeruginosa]